MTQTSRQTNFPGTGFSAHSQFIRPVTILPVFLAMIILTTAFAGCLEFDWDDDERKTDNFTYYIAAAPQTLDPAVAYDDVSINIISNLYERLMTYQSETSSSLIPMVAASKVVENDQTYTFNMRGDVKFSSGRIITAEDVRYSFQRVLKMEQDPSWMLRQVLNESGILVDDYNFDGIDDVKFQLTMPYSGFIHIIAFSVCSIVDKDVVDAHGGVLLGQKNDWVAHNSAGSGAYKVENWNEADGKVHLTRNSHYNKGWGGKHLETIDFKVQSSELMRLEAIRGDNADMADIPLSLLTNLTDETSVRIDIRDTMSVVFLGFNTETAPFDQVEVRKAFSFAFNYNDLMDIILEERYGDRLYGPIPEGVDGHDSNLANRFFYDPNDALDQFEAAGYDVDDGKVTDFDDLTFSLPFNTSVMGRILLQLRENLAALGIEVDIEYIGTEAYTQGLERGDFPVYLAGWSADYADPDDFVYPLLHSESSNLSISNLARFNNATIDEMIEDGKETLSPSDRKVIYRDLQNAVNDNVPYIWLYQPKSVSVLKSDVSGFNKHPILGTNFYDVSIIA